MEELKKAVIEASQEEVEAAFNKVSIFGQLLLKKLAKMQGSCSDNL